MDTTAIRVSIAEACSQEHQSHSLHRFFSGRLEELGQRLILPREDPVAALVNFARSYIEYVPDFLDQIEAQGRQEEAQGYVNMAADFFLAPPGVVAEDQGLKALLDEAFLAQRLLEEVNDQQLCQRAPPLLCLDMTRANIIVHHLLGDRLAGRLEELITQCLDLVADNRRQFSSFAPAASSGERPWEEAPCMSRGACIDLRLGYQPSSPVDGGGEG